MARNIALVTFGVIVGVLGGAALQIHAAGEGGVSEEPAETTQDSALEPSPTPEPAYGVWDRLAACESSGNWHIASGNGYFGGLQFDLPSWRAAGGSGRPDQASRAEQIRVGQNWQHIRGWSAWPVCSRVIGVR